MAKRFIIFMFVAVFGMLVLYGCGGESKKVDPYAEVSLQQATRGPVVVSKGFKYKLRNPEIVETNGHILLVKEGNIVEMIAGRSIADKLEGLDLSNIEFNVVKIYSPYTHFKCEQIVSGTDTVFISAAGAIDYPRVTSVEEFEVKEHDDYDLDRLKYNRTADLRKAVDKQFLVTGTVSLVEEDGDETWILTGDKGSVVRIVDPTDGVNLVLKLLAANNMEFEGGITFTEVEPWPDRKDNLICGNVEIDFVRYLDKYVGI
jgi:hypothetical protein